MTATVCSTVDDSMLSDTMISVYDTVVVSVEKMTSTDGVLRHGQFLFLSRDADSTYTVVTTGDPNIETQADVWATGLLSRIPTTCCKQELTVHDAS